MDAEEVLKEIAALYGRIKEAEARARWSLDHYLDELQRDYEQRSRAIAAAFEQARGESQAAQTATAAQAAADFAGATGQVRAQVGEMASAFRWTVAPWSDPAWQTYMPSSEAAIPSAVRVGRLALADTAQQQLGDLPALAGLIGQGHLFLTGEDPALVRSLLQTVLLRLILTFPPGTLRLVLADPASLGTTLAMFLRLPDTLRGDKVYARAEEIERQLDRLVTHIENVVQTRLLDQYPTIAEYNAQAGEIAVPYQVLALADYAASFNERMVDRLLHVARNGPRAGVYIVAGLNPAYPPPQRSGSRWS